MSMNDFGNSNKPIKDKDGGFYVLEKVDLSQDSDAELNDEVADISELEDVKVDEEELNDLDKLINSTKEKPAGLEFLRTTQTEKRVEPKQVKRTEVIDDFIRNFMIKHKMKRSLEVFQQEWYELAQKGKFSDNELGPVPDIFIKNERLEEKVQSLTGELDKAKILAEKAKATWDKLRKERDFHKMHHHRVQQEKLKLNKDIDKLKELHKQYESKYQDLSNKYEAAMKEKMLLKLEKDRLVAKSSALQKTVENLEDKITKDLTGGERPSELKDTKAVTQGKTQTKAKLTPFPDENRTNPYQNQSFDSFNTKNIQLNRTFPGHQMAISSLAIHPTKNFIATASDDLTWKVWTYTGELLLSGEGHKDWVCGIAFHPKGNHLATSSGDSTIKFWDFVHAKIVYTFTDHIQPVWSVAINDTGDFLASASMDHTCKLFDLNVGKNRYTFRGHVDSVNHVTYQNSSNIFATASADKTVSLWDMKSGLCIQTFYGHLNSINHCAFTPRGDALASCDSDGIVKVWDIRMVKERNQFDSGPYSANCCAFDKSGTVLAVGGDEKLVKLYHEPTGRLETTLKGHEDAIHDLAFDYHTHKLLITAGSDKTFRIWQ